MDRLTTLHKIQHRLVELDTNVVRPGDKRTRGQHRLYQPAAKLSIYKNSFFPRTIWEWNLLPTSVTDATTIEEFRVDLGHALPALQQYPSRNAYFKCTYRDFNFWKDAAVSFPSHWSTVHSFEESWPILGRRRRSRKVINYQEHCNFIEYHGTF